MKVNSLNLNIHQVLIVSFICTVKVVSQHSVCITLAIQADLATSNLSLSPDDWISSFPLAEMKERKRQKL